MHLCVCIRPTLSSSSSLLSFFLLGFLSFLDGSQFGLMLLLQGVPLLPVVQQAVQHGGDLHMETTELLGGRRASAQKINQCSFVKTKSYTRLGLSDFSDTAIYIDILFPDKVSIFQPRVSFFFFLANFIEKSDVTISENTAH